MSDIKFDIYESPQMTGKEKIPCEKHQQADHPLEGLIHEATLYTSVSRSTGRQW